MILKDSLEAKSCFKSSQTSHLAARVAMENPQKGNVINAQSSRQPSSENEFRENLFFKEMRTNGKNEHETSCRSVVLYRNSKSAKRYPLSTKCARISYMQGNKDTKTALTKKYKSNEDVSRMRKKGNKYPQCKSKNLYDSLKLEECIESWSLNQKQNENFYEHTHLNSRDDSNPSSCDRETFFLSDEDSEISLMEGLSSIENGYPDEKETLAALDNVKLSDENAAHLGYLVKYFQNYTDKIILKETLMDWEDKEPSLQELTESTKYLENLADTDHRTSNKPFLFLR
ncbi:Schizosaccharomyces specific protein Mug125 [Schizosaccharomyces pombe]|uniref:Meiotically up-regulated gene 125 protein n=1 Tax=Schizosaccharomyces pombe (strain 972 / ATCC 24843) TaxID=284812 RepID=MU125_SCHPO|nr:protein mug125 [Schizosaccharomyces pombe]O13859.1 RecName: Full=Meiotically up-regulated gene 125 protein [Schizosaccharomyces pombe 972h-]CAB16358.1 sequence orphan [Schizosaccharomyces pombe]|eukprot:NP_593200.1 protein mug125 [Schizosaccharomyces pombe]